MNGQRIRGHGCPGCGKATEAPMCRTCRNAQQLAESIANRAVRFWARVDKSGGPDACWPWTGAKQRAGYGHLTYLDASGGRRWTGAHRLALTLALGREVLVSRFVIHMCDNPPCCNPRHLAEGTPAENTADMWAKGRAVVLRGVDHRAAKLTPQAVREIRALQGVVSSPELARRYGVTYQSINAIHHRRAWTHVA